MKADFATSLKLLLQSEGGFSDDPRDPGGATNLGVTRQTLAEWTGKPVTVEDMRTLTVADVTPIYERRYWDALRCDDLPAGVDYFAFDSAVNQGPKRAATWLQLAAQMNPDGIVGPLTVAAAQKAGAEALIASFYSRRWLAYRQDPDFDHFGNGWLARLERVRDQALALASGEAIAA